MKNLLIIIPAYNEAESIGEFLDGVLSEPVCEIADILVIDDGSLDNTSEIALSKGVKAIRHVFNLGYACALQTGYKYASSKHYEYLIQIDADGQHDTKNIQRLYDVLTKNSESPVLVIGSRFLSLENKFKPSGLKLFAIKMFRQIIKTAGKTSITDPTSGLQGMNRPIFIKMSQYNNFFVDYPDANNILNLLFHKYKVIEIEAVMHPRKAGESMHSGIKPFIYMVTMLLSIIIVILRERSARLKGIGSKC